MTLSAAVQHLPRDSSPAMLGQAINQLADTVRLPPAAAVVLAHPDWPMPEIASALHHAAPGLPVWGFSASEPLPGLAQEAPGLTLLVLAGSDLQAVSHRMGEPNAPALLKSLSSDLWLRQALLLAVDGIGMDPAPLLSQTSGALPPTLGALTGRAAPLNGAGHGQMLGGGQVGSGGVAWMLLSGSLRLGWGCGHGWEAVGPTVSITRSNDCWVHNLDDQPAAVTYARIFGGSSVEWGQPPLNQLVRQYPLGIESSPGQPLQVRSPAWVEPDGSFRMHTHIGKGKNAFLLVGGRQAALKASASAARQALGMLRGARPVCAFVLIDVAWKQLFLTDPRAPLRVVREVLGDELPTAAAYTVGQITGPNPVAAQLWNQQICVGLLGATETY